MTNSELPSKAYFRFNDTDLKWKDGKINTMHQYPRRAKVAVLIQDKINFKTKIITRGKKGHFK